MYFWWSIFVEFYIEFYVLIYVYVNFFFFDCDIDFMKWKWIFCYLLRLLCFRMNEVNVDMILFLVFDFSLIVIGRGEIF